MAKVAIFASGRGSNFIAIHEFLEKSELGQHAICCLASDKPDCPAVAYARSQNIPVLMMDYAKGKDRESTETQLLAQLSPYAPDLLVLAGFMRLLSPVLVDAWSGRIINIHPSLLPKYPGVHGIQDSFASGDSWLGISIHYVDHGLDSGPIIIQKSFERSGSESLVEIEERIHRLEHETYPVTVWNLLESFTNAKNGGPI